ncbi:hypothetical protein H0H81_002542 [Sphagnurus paluster]|uniref:Uncharacterized protein n=1 Tax=Sphagnurus paluster TaxID=117069 RepID=A0A9P7FM30_9AGAR|nr:hypothetical protein H0H81_002542 [Sphagnurus paluster]
MTLQLAPNNTPERLAQLLASMPPPLNIQPLISSNTADTITSAQCSGVPKQHSVPEERRKMVACMRARLVELASSRYGCRVLQKALDCEDIRLLIVSELLLGDPAQTLVNKHASHVWRLTPIQHAFENLEVDAKDGIVDELINNGSAVFGEVAKNQWGSYCIQHRRKEWALKEDGKATLDRIDPPPDHRNTKQSSTSNSHPQV